MAEIILIRADASPAIGTGHVMRCLTLAQAARARGVKVIFATSRSSEPLFSRIVASGADVHWMESNHGGAEDAAEAVAVARLRGAKHAVIDGYHFDSAYQRTFRDAGRLTLAVDDYGHAERYVAHLVLNQNLGVDEHLYLNRAEDTRLLLGPRFAMVRPEFVAGRAHKRNFPPNARTILITLGGADPDNRTAHVLRSLSCLDNADLKATVVVGGENLHFHEINALVEKADFPVRVMKNAENMAELMADADLAVAAAGSTTWELLCMGVPTVTGIIAKNQELIAQALDREKITEVIGWFSEISQQDLAARIDRLIVSPDLRRSLSERGREIVDGEGVLRVLDALESLSA